MIMRRKNKINTERENQTEASDSSSGSSDTIIVTERSQHIQNH